MTVYQQINTNKRKSVFLVMLFIAFVLGIGFFIGEYYGDGGGIGGLMLATVIATFMTLLSLFAGDKVSLLSAGAKEIRKEDNPYVWRLVENLSITAGLPMPRIYLINDPIMNAFATGRNPKKASIALTTGIVEGLENEELEGVIAHELSHIKNYDTRLMMIVVILVGTIALLAEGMWHVRWLRGGRNKNSGSIELIFMAIGFALIILSPIIAELIKMAISRKREFLADASAVLLTRYAAGLKNALLKIDQQSGKMLHANNATAHLYIANPFGADRRTKTKKWLGSLFSTHPPIAARIEALAKM
ncbi:MAG: zinc metalloprotease HtpX [Candidatus Kerfeldbacteria bacterium RIFOXYC2_FULL_38_9]|uniref:Protease HtpX homolog n=1 Tax=Candidatus Kerfeldbacteria bacterium RIFOXYB2_FULL_38_14 TaxID=1798547 RepID=A0A1G2BBZ9_9BACT|nr:MAG: zinc metalloprotease HtpX [Candidatus Kerfeldbacteria bacterium RIFOXYB2_FULL_38_14]OGY89005.1 MAG: zinc metalloprotease HtpX [Candidatus Kerfeldbacteria bacterium RIFOXYC2_FULL_38_9]